VAKVMSTSREAALYEQDFPLWAERQAELLRARRFDALDLDNLIEEVEDFSRRERDTVESFTETIIEHLLKLALSPASRPRRGWVITVAKQRAKLGRKLTTTLRDHLKAELPSVYTDMRRPFTAVLARNQVPAEEVPPSCPFTLGQILDPDWYPENVHGVSDPQP
jgi:Domain of unknown function DUF29